MALARPHPFLAAALLTQVAVVARPHMAELPALAARAVAAQVASKLLEHLLLRTRAAVVVGLVTA